MPSSITHQHSTQSDLWLQTVCDEYQNMRHRGPSSMQPSSLQTRRPEVISVPSQQSFPSAFDASGQHLEAEGSGKNIANIRPSLNRTDTSELAESFRSILLEVGDKDSISQLRPSIDTTAHYHGRCQLKRFIEGLNDLVPDIDMSAERWKLSKPELSRYVSHGIVRVASVRHTNMTHLILDPEVEVLDDDLISTGFWSIQHTMQTMLSEQEGASKRKTEDARKSKFITISDSDHTITIRCTSNKFRKETTVCRCRGHTLERRFRREQERTRYRGYTVDCKFLNKDAPDIIEISPSFKDLAGRTDSETLFLNFWNGWKQGVRDNWSLMR